MLPQIEEIERKRKRANMLDMGKIIKLSEWLRKRSTNADWKNQTKSTLCEQATSELGFEVNTTNIASVAAGLELKFPKSQVAMHRHEQTAKLRRQIKQLHEELNLLKSVVGELCRRAGIELPGVTSTALVD
jgi:hypothetical protein